MKYLINQIRHKWIGQYFKRFGKVADITDTHVLIILPNGQSLWSTWPFAKPDYFEMFLTKDK
jgi:hypothetical protein